MIAAAGPLPGQFTTDNLKQWSKLRKGVFTEEFEENVTHLLCTREQFDDRVPRSASDCAGVNRVLTSSRSKKRFETKRTPYCSL